MDFYNGVKGCILANDFALFSPYNLKSNMKGHTDLLSPDLAPVHNSKDSICSV